ncbi:MAG TPA: hypothetical protein VD859_13190 [Nocardioides sp.]|nr:hypothetical protein [Nocardioides sp.]
MKIIRWAAILVTALFALMNLGAVGDADAETWVRAVGVVLAVLGLGAAAGLALNQSWGGAAVVAVGLLNIVAAVVALGTSEAGGGVGIAVGALGAILGFFSNEHDRDPARV